MSTFELQIEAQVPFSINADVPSVTVFTVTIGDTGSTTPNVGGGGSIRYTHTQAVASALWIINHNLGMVPVTQAFNVGSVEIVGAVENPTLNQTRIVFNAAVSGFALCL